MPSAEKPMPDLGFQIEAVSVVPNAVAPTLAFQLRATNAAPNETIHAITLRCQIHLEVARRRYTPEEQESLVDLFSTPDRWSQTLRTMLWTNAYMVIPAFSGATTTAELQIPCTFDFNVAATKYFAGLSDGEVPVLFLFSGSVFYAPSDGALQVAPISWEQEAKFKLPVNVWREMMDAYYPNCVWLNLRRDVFDRLHRYKMERGIPTWEQALEEILSNETMVKS